MAVEPATNPELAPAGWDPAWPDRPWEPVGPHDLHPDPTGPPVDRHDDIWHDYDGPDQWPPDWPGRWRADPAVTAATGNQPHDRADGALCAHCRKPPAPLPAPRRGVVELQLPLTTALGLDDLPGELNGYGPILGEIARHIATHLPDAQWRYSVYTQLPELALCVKLR